MKNLGFPGKQIQETSFYSNLGIKTNDVLLKLSEQGIYQDCFLAVIIAQEGQEYTGNAWDRGPNPPTPVRGDLPFVVEQVIYRACWISAISCALSCEAATLYETQDKYALSVASCYLRVASTICRRVLMFCEEKRIPVGLEVLSAITQIEQWILPIWAIRLPDDQEKCSQICEEIREWVKQIEKYMVWE